MEVESVYRVDDDRHAGGPRGESTHDAGDGAVRVDEVRLAPPEESRETPGRARQRPGVEPARRVDDGDGKTGAPDLVHVFAGAADDPVLDRRRVVKVPRSIEEYLLGRGGRVDHVDDAEGGRHGGAWPRHRPTPFLVAHQCRANRAQSSFERSARRVTCFG